MMLRIREGARRTGKNFLSVRQCLELPQQGITIPWPGDSSASHSAYWYRMIDEVLILVLIAEE